MPEEEEEEDEEEYVVNCRDVPLNFIRSEPETPDCS